MHMYDIDWRIRYQHEKSKVIAQCLSRGIPIPEMRDGCDRAQGVVADVHRFEILSRVSQARAHQHGT